MTNVPPPPRRNRGLMAAVPKVEETPDNLSVPAAGLQDMNFKVDPSLHRAFKTCAVLKGMSMKELLEASFRCWLEQFGDENMRRMMPPTQN